MLSNLVRQVDLQQVEHVLELRENENSVPLFFKLHHHFVQQLHLAGSLQQLSAKIEVKKRELRPVIIADMKENQKRLEV